MLTLNYSYRIYPSLEQAARMVSWLESCRSVYNLKDRGHGFPRFKKFGQYRSFVFPQFKKNPVQDGQIKLPKLGMLPIVLHCSIPDGFDVKTVRVVRKHSGWFATLCIQVDVSILDVMPHGYGVGVDVGLEYFLSFLSKQVF